MSGMTVFDSILIWDKIMTMEQRKELITNCWSVDKKIIEYDENFLPLMEQSGENMSDLDRKKLHQAMTLSPRAMYFKKKLVKLEHQIEKQWNKVRCMRRRTKNSTRSAVDLFDIMPRGLADEVIEINYDNLSFTTKNLLRATYNPDTNRFERLGYCCKARTKSE